MSENQISAETYTTEQIGALLQVGTARAQQIIREIKSVSDTLGVSGIIHVQDYKYWLSLRLGKATSNKK